MTIRKTLPALLVLTLACVGPEPSSQSRSPKQTLAGSWRGVLASPGGELPFTLRITASPAGGFDAAVLNRGEAAPIDAVEVNGEQVVLRFSGYDSEITARLEDDGKLAGTWRRTGAKGDSTLAFTAVRGDERRFQPVAELGLAPGDTAAVADVSGRWAVVFTDEDGGTEPAQGELHQEGTRVEGTFLTPTGDYRFLEGSYEQGLLRLSTFDGAHAFLFDARAQSDGTLAGNFWSRDAYHATWTARRLAEGEGDVLPDAWQQVGLKNSEGRFHFAFPGLDGQTVSLADPRFAGKVVLVNLFGSWCPNCNDEAPLLTEWYRRYHDQGLEIVGLAYEMTGDPERDKRFVARFAERYKIEYPLLLAGVSDKAKASETLPDLSAVFAFPTNLFIGRDGRVRKIHSGFAGPGTGEHHERLVAELEGLIEQLLAEPAPAGRS